MEDNRNLETQIEDQSGQVDQDEKKFTQKEVDEIVKNRLARERKRSGADDSEKENPGQAGGRSLDERELRVMGKEMLQEYGMPTKLVDVLKFSDEESLEKAIEMIQEIKGYSGESKKSWGQRHGRGGSKPDPIRKAMGLDRG